MEFYRPWGQIDWLIPRLRERRWSLIGCVGTERRSVAMAAHLGRDLFEHVRLLEIMDPEPLDAAAVEARLLERRLFLTAEGFGSDEIIRHSLQASLDTIAGVVDDIVESGATSILIDVTSLPKYWFFALIQAALADGRLRDVIVTYTSGIGYAESLSENISPLRVLPGFNAGDAGDQRRSLIIGIGFEPTGLDTLLTEQDHIRLIFPFPPGPPGHRRNWMFVKHVEDLTQTNRIDPPDRVHIHMYDCPQVFDALRTMTDDGEQPSALAPYGPKTVSLAMCLFALAAAAARKQRVPVYYAQPLRYHIDYTKDVALRNGVPDTVGYCVRLSGRDLYTLPQDI